MSSINNYLGLCRKANYLVIGADNLKDYHKKLYLLVVCGELTKNINKIIQEKVLEYDIPCIYMYEPFGNFIGVENCKIIGIKNKGMSEQILKFEKEFKFYK